MPAEPPALHAPVRLKLDSDALVSNWRALAKKSGSALCGAAVKADGYGLGARAVVKRLAAEACKDFFVAHWREAEKISDLVPSEQISVLNGLTAVDTVAARKIGAVPVLNTKEQIATWKAAGGGRCHVMLDTGINRLGIGPEQLSSELLDGLDIDILMSHLASADEDSEQNDKQRVLFGEMSTGIDCKRMSLANSAGIMLGTGYHFDLTRPGLSLYGGIARPELGGVIRPVVSIEARVLQVRSLQANDPVGYNATFECPSDMPVATIALGYADGYLRAFSNNGCAKFDGKALPVIGRVSMDLVTLDASLAPDLREGDWVSIDYDLEDASKKSGLSQYELLTGLGDRFDRIWD